MAARLAPDGSVLDDPPIPLSSSGTADAIARGSAGSLAVWSEWPSATPNVYARRIGHDGTLMGSAATQVASNAESADVAFDGSKYLVVWRDSTAIRAARLTSDAVVLDATPILIDGTTTYTRPAVTAGSTGFVVAWRDEGGNSRLARVASSGVVLDPGGVMVPNSDGHADIGFDGTSFLPVFAGDTINDVLGARFASTGAFLDPVPFPISSGFELQEVPRVASRSGEHLVVWSASGGGIPLGDVSGRRVAANGTLLGSQQTSFALGANDQLTPAVASDGNDFLLLWRDQRNGYGDLYAERIAGDGTVLDPLGIELLVADDGQEWPEVIFDGKHYFAVWQDRRDGELDVYGARLDPTGKVLDPGGFPIASSGLAELSPALAANGSLTFVTWSHGGGFEPDVHAARVSSTGELLDPTGFVVAEGPGSQSGAAVASDGTDFFVVWSHTETPVNTAKTSELRGARYAKDGTLLTPTPFVVAAAPGTRYVPRIAFGKGVYLVVWHDDRNETSAEWDIYATRVSPAGDVLDPDGIRITQAAGADVWPDVTWNGETFVVAWNGSVDKRVARVDAGGVLLDPDGFSFSPVGQWGQAVRLAANEMGTTLVGYERYDHDPAFRSDRVRARTLTFVEEVDSGLGSDAGDASDDTGSGADAAPNPDAGMAGTSGTGSTRTVPVDDDSGCGCSTPRESAIDWSAITLALALSVWRVSARGRRLRSASARRDRPPPGPA
jgi:hypothetical protein